MSAPGATPLGKSLAATGKTRYGPPWHHESCRPADEDARPQAIPAHPAQRDALEQQFRSLDPIALARDIGQTLDLVWKLADTRHAHKEVARG